MNTVDMNFNIVLFTCNFLNRKYKYISSIKYNVDAYTHKDLVLLFYITGFVCSFQKPQT